MDSSEPGKQAPETDDTRLKELFDSEIALERNRRTYRILTITFLFLFMAAGLYGIFLLSQPGNTPAPEAQPQVTPGPEITQPAITPGPDTTQPEYADQNASTKDQSGMINGKANPGFPYWPSGTITYQFDSNDVCNFSMAGNFLRAFKIIDDKTGGLVTFVQSPDGAISISCHDSLGAMGASGWSGPSFSPSGLIHNATIGMYTLPAGSYACDSYPTLELREVLHVLGFEDTSLPGNLMYSAAGVPPNPCGELDAGIVNCLKNIYSNGKQGQACTGIPHK